MSDSDSIVLLAKKVDHLIQTAQLHEGDYWYIISSNWFGKWEIYVENAMKDGENLSSEAPGPIENSSLLDANNNLRPNLLESIDYVLVPEEGWEELVDVFGFKELELLRRRVVVCGLYRTQATVEIYPISIALVLNRSVRNAIFSAVSTLNELREEARKLFDLPRECRLHLFLRHQDTKHERLSHRDGKTQLQSLVHPDATVIVHAEWPAQQQTQILAARVASSSDNFTPNFLNWLERIGWFGQEFMLFLFDCVYIPSLASSTANVQEFENVFKRLWRRFAASISVLTPPVSESNNNKVYNTATAAKMIGPKTENPENAPIVLPPGVCGLRNLGNTCFMNSAVQCLSNIPGVRTYFISNQFERELNLDNKLGSRGFVARAFARLVQQLWSQPRSAVALPRRFKVTVDQFAPVFGGFRQHDAQEFLSFLLDALHEDLNRKRRHVPTPRQSDSVQKPSDQLLAAQAWRAHQERNDSIVVDLFHGQLKSTLVCPECQRLSVTFDPFCFLSLPLPKRTQNQSTSEVEERNLYRCIDLFTNEEILNQENAWFCPFCKNWGRASKKLELFKLPKILVIHLKRFRSFQTFWDKDDSLIEFPLSDLDLSKWYIGPEPHGIYDLVAICEHHGAGLCTGHYTCKAFNNVTSQWYFFNDERVMGVRESQKEYCLITPNAYVLFYQRRE